MATIISSDEIKKNLPDYSPQKAEVFHQESARIADKEFGQKIKGLEIDEIVIMSGGAASGKTEFLLTHLANKKRCLIFDTTLSSEVGAKIKMSKILNLKKKPIVYAVIPDDLKRAFTAFLHRDRKFSDIHFYKTHSGSRKTLLWITKNFPKVEINIIESSFTNDQKMHFTKIEFYSKPKLIKYLQKLQLSEADIISQVL